MSLNNAMKYLEEKGYKDRVMIFDSSSATVELAAKAVGTEPCKIAKSLTFKVDDKPIMILCAGDVKINNQAYKAKFHQKAKMLSREEVETLIGHNVGGVCPFGINAGVDVYLDESLKRFDYIYPAAGSANSAVKLTIEELETLSNYKEWIDVCKSI
ncbi:MAG TPA: YbaK/EbsC family protein [Clostridiales bacterium]|nr:YbaK/EbsC family protein [Clostridiales bacterium]